MEATDNDREHEMNTRTVEIIGTTQQQPPPVDAKDGEIWQGANGTEWHCLMGRVYVVEHGGNLKRCHCSPGPDDRDEWLTGKGCERVYPPADAPQPASPSFATLRPGDIIGYGQSDVQLVTAAAAAAVVVEVLSLITGVATAYFAEPNDWHLIARRGTGRIVIHTDGEGDTP